VSVWFIGYIREGDGQRPQQSLPSLSSMHSTSLILLSSIAFLALVSQAQSCCGNSGYTYYYYPSNGYNYNNGYNNNGYTYYYYPSNGYNYNNGYNNNGYTYYYYPYS
ncbi:hypothetical protein PMAYCL1PPCAC_29248, partial [Pristionchus mayeri]